MKFLESVVLASCFTSLLCVDDMMMIGDLNEDGIHMEIELAHSPEMLDPADAPSAMVGDPLLYNDYTSYAQ